MYSQLKTDLAKYEALRAEERAGYMEANASGNPVPYEKQVAADAAFDEVVRAVDAAWARLAPQQKAAITRRHPAVASTVRANG